jgi:hypothetical protein
MTKPPPLYDCSGVFAAISREPVPEDEEDDDGECCEDCHNRQVTYARLFRGVQVLVCCGMFSHPLTEPVPDEED